MINITNNAPRSEWTLNQFRAIKIEFKDIELKPKINKHLDENEISKKLNLIDLM